MLRPGAELIAQAEAAEVAEAATAEVAKEAEEAKAAEAPKELAKVMAAQPAAAAPAAAGAEVQDAAGGSGGDVDELARAPVRASVVVETAAMRRYKERFLSSFYSTANTCMNLKPYMAAHQTTDQHGAVLKRC